MESTQEVPPRYDPAAVEAKPKSKLAKMNERERKTSTVFGQHQKLEPLRPDKKLMWKREMNCLLSVCDYIVELAPGLQTLEDGNTLEVMTSRTRSDIYLNLPAMRKLDAMLLDILDSFEETEFWYVDEKWWLPVPCVPSTGLSEKSIKHSFQKRDCAYQIHQSSMSINNSILAEMEIRESYLATLPKEIGKFYRKIRSFEAFFGFHDEI